jgi:hypothetical protein
VAVGAPAFNKEVNELAAKGWELINGSAASTLHHGYMRRSLKRTGG